MKTPTITGIIDRRILVNFAIDPEVAKTIVPLPFKPKIVNGKAIAGICLIRLKELRPKGLPAILGMGSENGAHRIAVEWQEGNRTKEGVYIPRRDSSSRFNTIVGGRFFPGLHYHAKFDVKESGGSYHVAFESSDGATISIDAKITDVFNRKSVFKDLETASAFFETGSTGYSPNGDKYEGLLLRTENWKVTVLEISRLTASFFEDESIFPKGTAMFDNALLMTNIQHDWYSQPEISALNH